MDVKAYDKESIQKIRDEVLEQFRKDHREFLDEMISGVLDIEDALILEAFIAKLFKK